MTRIGLMTIMLLLGATVSVHAQVDIADPGESGFGLGAALSTQEGDYAYVGNASYTAIGKADFGFSLGRVGGSGSTATVMGLFLTMLPLQSEEESLRWSFGGLLSYDRFTVKDYGEIGTSTTYGGLFTVDAAASSKTDIQLAGALARTKWENADPFTTVTASMTIITKKPKDNTFVSLSVGVPTRGSADPTYGIQFGFFHKVKGENEAR